MSHTLPAGTKDLPNTTKWFDDRVTGVMISNTPDHVRITVSDEQSFYTMQFVVEDGAIVKTVDIGEPL